MLIEPEHYTDQEINDLFLKTIQGNVIICDGERFGMWEDSLIKYFNKHNISFQTKENLYNDNIDLSVFNTICFISTFTHKDKVNQLMAFDKSNLKSIVVDFFTYQHLKSITQELKLKVLVVDTMNGIKYKHNIQFIDHSL